jgi:outer membrane receptor protein involved in Fe transport
MRVPLTLLLALAAGSLPVSTAHAGRADDVPQTVAGQPDEPQVPASAAQNDQQLPRLEETVKVTAEKWEEDRQRVPLSLTVVDPALVDASGALLLNQIGPYVPGLYLRVDGDRSFNKPSLRGITSSPFNEAAVGVYVDEVPVDPRMGLATPLVDAERIEVVRGAQGVIWGRNTSGGVVHLVTRSPGNTWHTRADARTRGRRAGQRRPTTLQTVRRGLSGVGHGEEPGDELLKLQVGDARAIGGGARLDSPVAPASRRDGAGGPGSPSRGRGR